MNDGMDPGNRVTTAEPTTNKNSEASFDRLNRRIQATKSIRFRSHVRLLRRHKLSSYVVAMLSIYVIGISLMPNIYLLSVRQNQVLLSCTIVMSTFIICLVLTEGSESFDHKADLLHESARRLNELMFDYSLEALPSIEHMQKTLIKYNQILQQCPLNHAECDYLWVKARNPHLFGYESPKFPLSFLDKSERLIIQFWDGLRASCAEFAWLAIPFWFCVMTTYAMYCVVAFGWPDGAIPMQHFVGHQ